MTHRSLINWKDKGSCWWCCGSETMQELKEGGFWRVAWFEWDSGLEGWGIRVACATSRNSFFFCGGGVGWGVGVGGGKAIIWKSKFRKKRKKRKKYRPAKCFV